MPSVHLEELVKGLDPSDFVQMVRELYFISEPIISVRFTSKCQAMISNGVRILGTNVIGIVTDDDLRDCISLVFMMAMVRVMEAGQLEKWVNILNILSDDKLFLV